MLSRQLPLYLNGFIALLIGLLLAEQAFCRQLEPATVTARRLYLHGRYEEALEHYDTAEEGDVSEESDGAGVAVGRARCHRAMGQAETAERLLRDCLDKHPDQVEPRSELACLLLDRGRWKQAEDQVAKVLERDSNHPTARWVTAELHRRNGRLDEAERAYGWFIERFNDSGDWSDEHLRWVGLAAAQHARWSWDTPRPVVGVQASACPLQPKGCTPTDISNRPRDSEQFRYLVRTFYPDLFSRYPDYWPARLDRARLFLEKYNVADARSDLDIVMATNARTAELYAARAELALQAYDLPRAQAAIEQALAINPHLPAAIHAHADLLLADLRPDDAIAVLEPALKWDPFDEGTLGRLAAAYLAVDGPETQDQDRYGRLVREVRDRNPRCGAFFVTLGDSMDRMRKYPQAAIFYREALQAMPRLMYARGQLGLVLMRLGDEAAAAGLLAESFRIDPFNVRVRNMLQVLDVLQDYTVLETEHFVLKFDGGRDRILGPWASRYLEQEVYPHIVGSLEYEPPGKTLIEIFCRAKNTSGHGWFSARMTGLPFVGSVGACAGRIVAMVSPNDLPEKFDWARVLRHEFVHVVTLQQTDFNIPHWYTEALAVRFERLARPAEWNRVLATRLREDTLFDLNSINMGFIRPEGPGDRTLAYCQAELYAEFLVQQFGESALVRLLEAYAANQNTDEALRNCFAIEPDDFEAAYRCYLRDVVSRSVLEAPPLQAASQLRSQLAERPKDADLWAALAETHLAAERGEEAERCAAAARRLQPGHARAGFVLARRMLQSGNRVDAVRVLEESVQGDAPNLRAVALLASLHAAEGRSDRAERLFQIGLKHQPDSELWLKSLARLYLLSGNQRTLEQTLARLADMEYDNLLVRKKLLELALARKDREDVRRWATAVLHIDVMDAEAIAAFDGAQEQSGPELSEDEETAGEQPPPRTQE